MTRPSTHQIHLASLPPPAVFTVYRGLQVPASTLGRGSLSIGRQVVYARHLWWSTSRPVAVRYAVERAGVLSRARGMTDTIPIMLTAILSVPPSIKSLPTILPSIITLCPRKMVIVAVEHLSTPSLSVG